MGDPAQMRQRAQELREQAKELRAEARRLAAEAAGEEFMASCHERLASLEHAERVASTMCRPVWAVERPGGPWVVRDIRDGRIVVGHPTVAGEPASYSIRTGCADALFVVERAKYGRLDVDATILAWRAWCAARRALASDVEP